jgi:hypothetical protein
MRSVVVVLCCAFVTSVVALEFNGVPESLMEQYNAAAPVTLSRTPSSLRLGFEFCRLVSSFSQNFKCLNGGELMPISQVNDNFCDCPDGSDEPGTRTGTIFRLCGLHGRVRDCLLQRHAPMVVSTASTRATKESTSHHLAWTMAFVVRCVLLAELGGVATSSPVVE